jgi:phosphoadenosine phosphosulfate reductase
MRGLAERVPDLERADAEVVLAHMLERHHPRLALACSFQKEDAVVIDMLLSLEPSARVFTIDTGVLFAETYAAWRALERHYGIRVEIFDALRDERRRWNASACCSLQKVAALEAALGGLDGWITGLRREQSPTRATAPKVSYDEAHGLWKANPIADWDAERVWDYIARHEVPYNALHDRGYDSIGCEPCTMPGSGREGRWAGSDRTECGIHI